MTHDREIMIGLPEMEDGSHRKETMMRRYAFIILGLILVGIICNNRVVGAEGVDETIIHLDRTIHFLSPDGQAMPLASGSYTVEPSGETALKIVDATSKASVEIQAGSGTHEEQIVAPTAVTMAQDEDLYHIALLLPGGKTLDALGAFSDVRTRGLPMMPLGAPQLNTAMGFRRPMVVATPLNQPGQPLQAVPVPVTPQVDPGIPPQGLQFPEKLQAERLRPPILTKPFPSKDPREGTLCSNFDRNLVRIDVTAVVDSSSTAVLSWSAPDGTYVVRPSGRGAVGEIQEVTLPIVIPPIAIKPSQQSRRHIVKTNQVRNAFGPITMPDFVYSYVVTGTLSDGRQACGGVSVETPPPPPIKNLVGTYYHQNNIGLSFDLPPYVHEVKFHRVYPIRQETIELPKPNLASGKDGVHISEVKITRPGLPELPNDYSQPVSYDFIIETIWTAYPDGSGPKYAVKTSVQISGPTPIWGFADTHAHQFANLGFGGLFVWGQVFPIFGQSIGGIQAALPNCDNWPQIWSRVTKEAKRKSGQLVSVYDIDIDPAGLPIFGVVHGVEGVKDLVGTLVAHQGPEFPHHSVNGFPTFIDWPRWNSVSHQMMYWEWLKRAYDGGMRLMVMHAVNSEFLCSVISHVYNCDDMTAVDRQLQAAIDLEQFMANLPATDSRRGLYKIVRTPQDARQAIANNQMAVVLGIETPDLFGCSKIPNPCTTQYVADSLQRYYDKGVRHLFPVHSMDNVFGGTAFFQDMYRIAQVALTRNPTDSNDVKPFDCHASDKIDFKFEPGSVISIAVATAAFPSYGSIRLPNFEGEGHCNTKGLTTTGEFLLGEMMKKHMIIDIDHMSHRTIDRVLELAETERYPVTSGHAGVLEVSGGSHKRHEAQQTGVHMARIAALGGMGGVITAQGPVWIPDHDGVTAYLPGSGVTGLGPQVKNDCSNSSKTFAQAYLFAIAAYGLGNLDHAAVSFGTDMQGAMVQPGPRIGHPPMYLDGCDGDKTFIAGNPRVHTVDRVVNRLGLGIGEQGNPVTYPFTLPGFAPLDNSEAFPGGKKYDVNVDGIAHVGMLPDFIEDLRHIGVTDNDLKPLFRSAEGYIRMWERASYEGPR